MEVKLHQPVTSRLFPGTMSHVNCLANNFCPGVVISTSEKEIASSEEVQFPSWDDRESSWGTSASSKTPTKLLANRSTQHIHVSFLWSSLQKNNRAKWASIKQPSEVSINISISCNVNLTQNKRTTILICQCVRSILYEIKNVKIITN